MTATNMYGALYLPTWSQRSLFCHELQGQLSDGMWENAAPHDHWQVWCRCDVLTGEPRFELGSAGWPRKTAYNFHALIPYVGDRMVNIGRMAKAAEFIGMSFLSEDQARYAAEYMPKTLTEYREYRIGAHASKHESKHINTIDGELAVAFYLVQYGLREMKDDLNVIKKAMKNVK